MAQIITIEIPSDGGPTTVDTAGYHGSGCQAVQGVFGRALGTTTKAVKKPEFNKPTKNKVGITR